MLERAESKSFLILLLILSLLALVSSITTMTLQLIWKHIGFLMSSANYTYLCSTYQTLKLHYNITYNYNASFIGCCLSILFQLFTLVHLIYLTVAFCKKQQYYFEELTESVFQRLYIGYSMSLLGISVGVGCYLSYIIQEGWNCLMYVHGEWIVLGTFLIAALVFLLVCWIYLLCFWFVNKHKFEQPIEISDQQNQVEQKPAIAEPYKTLKQETKIQYHEETNSIRQSLLGGEGGEANQVEEDDKVSLSSNGKQKLAIVPFEHYIKKQKQKEEKQYNQQELILKLLQQDQEKIINEQKQRQAKIDAQRVKKQYLRNVALSPDDPNFDQMFIESEKQEVKEEENKLQPYFSANFVPKNEQERQQFENYKKSLLDNYTSTHQPRNNLTSSNMSEQNSLKRHPQNIEGGRSKRLMSKYMEINKRPTRDESMYDRGKVNTTTQEKLFDKYFPIIREQNENEFSNRSSQPFKKQPKILFQPTSPVPVVLPQPIAEVQQPQQKSKRSPDSDQKPQILCFHKSRVKSPSKKKLFEQQQKFLTNQTFTSILHSLVKGVEQANHKKRLSEIRQRKSHNRHASLEKQGEKLLNQIRSKFS